MPWVEAQSGIRQLRVALTLDLPMASSRATNSTRTTPNDRPAPPCACRRRRRLALLLPPRKTGPPARPDLEDRGESGSRPWASEPGLLSPGVSVAWPTVVGSWVTPGDILAR